MSSENAQPKPYSSVQGELMPPGPTDPVPATHPRASPLPLPVASRGSMILVRWLILVLVGAAICASTAALVAVLSRTRSTTTAGSPYDQMVRDHLKAASASNAQALARYQAALNDIVARHQPRLDAMTREAAEIAAERRTLYPMLGYLARDRMWNTTKTDEWLQERIGKTMVDPVLQAFLDDIGKAADRLQSELDKETSKLAYDLAAKGSEVSPQSLRAKAHTDFVHLFTKPAVDAGRTGAVPVLALAFFDAPAIAKIGARLFSKQIARLALAPLIAAADGPLPVGEVIVVLLGLWSAWELHKLDAQFQQEVSDSLTHHLGQFREAALHDSRAFGASRLAAADRQQADIAADAAGHPLAKVMP